MAIALTVLMSGMWPSFLGYMLWSGAILLPLFALYSWIWFL